MRATGLEPVWTDSGAATLELGRPAASKATVYASFTTPA